jgi:hypothetical protein
MALFLEVSLLYYFLIYDRVSQMVLVPVLDTISFAVQNVVVWIVPRCQKRKLKITAVKTLKSCPGL